MNDDELNSCLTLNGNSCISKAEGFKMPLSLSKNTHTQDLKSDDAVIVSEIPITSGQLHSIAAGNYCMVGAKNEPFAIRFLLKSAFKLPNRNFVVRNIVMQIVAVGKENSLRRENIATDVKLEKVKSKVVKKVKEETKFEIEDKGCELF